VVRALVAGGEDALQEFIREWRADFLDFVGEAHHLPPFWSVDQRVVSRPVNAKMTA
jgi:hypothetical protein